MTGWEDRLSLRTHRALFPRTTLSFEGERSDHVRNPKSDNQIAAYPKYSEIFLIDFKAGLLLAAFHPFPEPLRGQQFGGGTIAKPCPPRRVFHLVPRGAMRASFD
jgi:hypothetical protein